MRRSINVDGQRLHPDQPALIPGLSAYNHWHGPIDLGTVQQSSRVRTPKGEDIDAYRARRKRESRHRNPDGSRHRNRGRKAS